MPNFRVCVKTKDHSGLDLFLNMLDIESNQPEARVPNSEASRSGKWSRLFILSAGVLLLLTGAAKIISGLGESPVLAKPDPIFGIHFNYLLLSVGLIELIISVLCFTSAKQTMILTLLAVLSLDFLAYRIGLWLTHWPGYCPCLGTLTKAMHLSPKRADLLSRVTLVYLVIGSFCFLIHTWRSHESNTPPG